MGVSRLMRDAYQQRIQHLGWSFFISVVFHGLLLLVFTTTTLLQLDSKKRKFTELQATPQQIKKAQLAALEQQKQEPPLIFVEVDPRVFTEDPPKDAKYYSSASSKAANPDASKDTPTPRIAGQQEKMIKTVDVTEPDPKPAQPLQPTPPPAKEEVKEARATPLQPSGNTLRKSAEEKAAKPVEKKTEPEKSPQGKPRTLAEARLRKGLLLGEKMKQEGGVKLQSELSSLDTKGTPLGEYDAHIIAAVQKHWYDLLERANFAGDRSGRVVVTFRLHPNGSITLLEIIENSVGDFLGNMCSMAINDPAPYRPWPPEVRRMIGNNYRDIRFSFHYN